MKRAELNEKRDQTSQLLIAALILCERTGERQTADHILEALRSLHDGQDAFPNHCLAPANEHH